MKRFLAALFAVFVPAFAFGFVQNPIPGWVWTYFGPTLGSDWAPLNAIQQPGLFMAYPSTVYTLNPNQTNAFTILYPPTNPVACFSTQDSCLTELLAAMSGVSGNAMLYGANAGQSTFQVNRTSGIGTSFPPLRSQFISLKGGGLGGIGGGADVLQTDSMLGATIDLDTSQIFMSESLTGTYTDATILINPHTPTPGPEHLVGVLNSEIKLGNVSRESPGAATVRIDAGSGNILHSTIEGKEINGAGHANTPLSSICFLVNNNTATTGLQDSIIILNDIHNCIDSGFSLGQSSTNSASLSKNTIYLARVHPALSGTTTTGVDDWGHYNHVTAYVDNDGLGTANLASCYRLHTGTTAETIDVTCTDANGQGNAIGVYIDTGADFNKINLWTNGTITTPILDQSNGGVSGHGLHNDYTVNGQIIQQWINGLQYNYQQPTSVSAGSGGVFQLGSGNSKGAITVGGTGTQQTATLNYSIAFLNPTNCNANTTQAGATITASAATTTSVTFNAINSTNAAPINMPAGTVITYECWGQGN